ncbi:MAG: adenylate kinase [Bacteroidetes bacterium GWF2_33_16]|nr:MAG: adenylate kinase [Bacteroidetes bacterium GWE2_32_14]OFY05218.1 MAG: adenylate kinase [Bacteroidetes bacterium GWF2_33_16]
MLNIILFGPPGAGKGTQSQKLIEKYGLVHISTGEILRINIAEKTPLGIEAQKYIDHGNYVSDAIALEIVMNEINKNIPCNGFVFDGFPRTTPQADEFTRILGKYNSEITVLISLEVDEETLVKRLSNRSEKSNRPDDTCDQIIKKRLTIYENNTKIVKNYYKKLNKYQSINGLGDIDKIFSDICKVIDNICKN